MKRREFISLLGGATAWTATARAEQPRDAVVGFLGSVSATGYGLYMDAFRDGLATEGFVVGRNLRLETRFAEGHYDRLPGLAAELVGQHVDVIVTGGGNPPAQAAKAATSTIPIVFISGGDPVLGRMVASFNRPGGNVTGVSWIATALVPKRLDLLLRLAPNPNVIGALINPTFEDFDLQARELQEAAAARQQHIELLRAATSGDIDSAFASVPDKKIGALIVANDPFFGGRRDQIVTLAAKFRIPAIYFLREFTAAGGLISYATSLTEANRQGGVYAGKVLKGTPPAELPVWQPTKFELVINLATSRALGLVVPSDLLVAADEVIE